LCVRTASAEQTRALGAALARALRPGDIVLLGGDLGTGKTTLTQGVARGLGVEGQVTSPTFTLVRSHPCRGGGAVRTLLHADLYRLDRLAEVADLAIGELVEDGAVAVVEWGDVAEPVLGADALAVVLSGGDDDGRSITLGFAGAWSVRRPDIAARLEPWAAP
jgi:tRNA threonylcarbamoyladenosine biosynthesis protein TsaE